MATRKVEEPTHREWEDHPSQQGVQPQVVHTWPDVDTSGSINEPPGSNTPPADESYTEPVPTLAGMTPQTCMIGDPDFTLFISGENFHGSTVINFAGHDEPTTLNEDGTLSTGVKPSLWLEPAVVPVLVRNGGMASDPVEFAFTDASARSRKVDHEEEAEPKARHRR